MSESATQESAKTKPGIFSWNELATSDMAGSEAFYTQLFGWKTESCPGMEHYKMLKLGDQNIGGLLDKSEQCDGPPVWLAYVNVEDVAASLAKAVKLGAEAFKEVTEIPGMGSFAIIKDPQGGMIALWQPAQQ